MINNELFKILNVEKIPYAVIEGKHDINSYKVENELLNPDIDIVLQTNSKQIISVLKSKQAFDYLGDYSFRENTTNTRIDLYFNSLNVGYYHFLKVHANSFVNQKLSEEEYIIYQILDPLLKFSKYYPRHQCRLEKYFDSGIPKEVKVKLESALGKSLSDALLSKISNKDFSISKIFIKRCKLRLLFINGNFVKMLKSRIF